MNTKLFSQIKTGCVYRRASLLHLSTAIDRDLIGLVQNGILEKIAAGIYYKPLASRFGNMPPRDIDVVQCFLNDSRFLLYSWDQYNTLGLGLTQLYNKYVVYNYKRHGIFTLGGKIFDFRHSARGFPSKLDPEFLLVDLLNNVRELTEDTNKLKLAVTDKKARFNKSKLLNHAKLYGKIATKRFITELYA